MFPYEYNHNEMRFNDHSGYKFNNASAYFKQIYIKCLLQFFKTDRFGNLRNITQENILTRLVLPYKFDNYNISWLQGKEFSNWWAFCSRISADQKKNYREN